jgi:hypothetical protein
MRVSDHVRNPVRLQMTPKGILPKQTGNSPRLDSRSASSQGVLTRPAMPLLRDSKGGENHG